MQVENYRPYGGVLPKLAALRSVVTNRRVIGRQTSAPLSELLLFGVAGGIGAAYGLARDGQGRSRPRLDLGPRYRGRPGEALQGMCVRLGLPASFRHTGSPDVAERGLRRALERDEPVIAFLAASALPYLASPGPWADEAVRPVVLYGMCGDEGSEEVLVADLSDRPVGLPLAALRQAWSTLPGLKHLMAFVDAPSMAVDLPKAIEAGLRVCCDRMLDPPHPRHEYGLPGLARLGRALSDGSDPEGWRAQLTTGADLYEALRDLFVSIELSDAGPAGGRGLFAAFLREASEVLQGPNLTDAIRAYDRLAVSWRALAEAALPDRVGPMGELRGLLLERHTLLREPPDEAEHELHELRERISALDQGLRQEFPLEGDAAARLLTELGAGVTRLVAEEEAAIGTLRLALR